MIFLAGIPEHTNTYKPPASLRLHRLLLTCSQYCSQYCSNIGVLSKFSRSQIPLSLLNSMTKSSLFFKAIRRSLSQ